MWLKHHQAFTLFVSRHNSSDLYLSASDLNISSPPLLQPEEIWKCMLHFQWRICKSTDFQMLVYVLTVLCLCYRYNIIYFKIRNHLKYTLINRLTDIGKKRFWELAKAYEFRYSILNILKLLACTTLNKPSAFIVTK